MTSIICIYFFFSSIGKENVENSSCKTYGGGGGGGAGGGGELLVRH